MLRRATLLRPTDGKLYITLCDALAAHGKAGEALSTCEKGLGLGEKSEEAQLVTLSVMKTAAPALSNIDERIEAALSEFPDSQRLLEFAADHYYWTQRFERSVEYWDRLTRIDPKSGYYFGRLAISLLSLERETEALTNARKALELDPSNVYGLYSMGRLFLELGQNGDAASAFDKLRIAKEKLPPVLYHYAVSESRRGRKERDIQAFREALQLYPDDYQTNYDLGVVLSDSGRFEEAIPVFRKAAALRPKEFDAKIGLGLVLFESTHFDEAISVLEEANRAKPGNEVVSMFLRVARNRQRDIPQIDGMKRAASVNPSDTQLRAKIVELLAYARRIEEAEPYVKEFLDLKPSNIRDYQWIAVAYVTAGKRRKALEVYEQALEVGDDPGPHMGMASIFQFYGQADKASAAYEKTLSLKPDSPGVLKLYADHLRDNGKRREALDAYRKVLGFRPNDGPALSNAAILSARLGETDTAMSYVTSLRLVDPRLARRIEGLIPSLRFLF